LLGELEGDGRIVICDMEAGLGTLSRAAPGQIDLVIVVAEPSVKSIDIARRASQIAVSRARVIVVANRVREQQDYTLMHDSLSEHELIAIPEESAIALAEREGQAPIDRDPDSPGVAALIGLAERIAAYRSSS
jgi:CO dehydrogenase nickel-insertion accessory protein CooC1